MDRLSPLGVAFMSPRHNIDLTDARRCRIDRLLDYIDMQRSVLNRPSALVCYAHDKVPYHFLYEDLYGNHRIFADDKVPYHFFLHVNIDNFEQKHDKVTLM